MLKINLLDRKSKVSTDKVQELLEQLGLADLTIEDKRLIGGFFAKLVLLFVVFWAANFFPEHIKQQKLAELDQKVNVLEASIKKLEAQLKAKEEVRNEAAAIQKKEDELKGKLAVVSSLDSDRYRAFKVMDTISLLIPEKVWIEGLTFNNKQVQFSGSSWEFVPINDFVALLKQSGVFDGVILKSINSTPAGTPVPGVPLALQTMKKYDISMDIKGSITSSGTAN